MEYLDKSEYVPYAPTKMGEQVHIDHADCEAGVDTKQRLYIKRVSGGIIAYCHHCGKRGKSTTKITRRPCAESLVVSHGRVELPYDVTETMPIAAQDWVATAGLNAERLVEQWGFRYSPSQHRLIMPIYVKGILSYWQGRYLGDCKKDSKPKYKNVSIQGYHPVFEADRAATGNLVLVEDILSAIKIYNSGCDAWAIMGTHLHDDVMLDICHASCYDSVTIWLDSDARTKAHSIGKRLQVFKNIIHVHTDLDPKYYTEEEIKQWIPTCSTS